MTEISNLAPIMFGSLVLAMLLGFPVAFTLGGLGLGFGYYAMSQGLFNEAFMGNLPLRLFGIVSNELQIGRAHV